MSDILYNNDAKLDQVVRQFLCSTTSALSAGTVLCFNDDYGTATAVDGRRGQIVEAPSVSNNRRFAGVLLNAKAAHTSGLVVVQAVVGGDALVLVGAASVTIGDYLTGDVSDGKFYNVGFQGRGTVKVLQTLNAAGLALARLLDGPESCLMNNVTQEADGAVALSPSGYNRLDGEDEGVDGALTYTLADGKVIGERWALKISATLAGSNDLTITVTNGIQADGTTALASIVIDDVNNFCLLEWTGEVWKLIYQEGCTLSS